MTSRANRSSWIAVAISLSPLWNPVTLTTRTSVRCALCRRHRRIPAPVARQGTGVDAEVSARDHRGVVGREEDHGLRVVGRTGKLPERDAGNARTEEAPSPWARVARPPERDAPFGRARHALGGVGGSRRET